MHITAIHAAAANGGDGGLVVGLLLGVCIGLLLAPALRSWLTYREWSEASRQARLADQVLARMEIDADPTGGAEPAAPQDDANGRRTWQTSR